jgi:Flp pilus assembly protein TadG
MAAVKSMLKRLSKAEHGAELVEFALTFPLLLVVVMGIIDFGLLFQQYEVLTNAAREGARVSVLPGYGSTDIQTRVNQYLQGTSLTSATVTTTVGAPQTLSIGSGLCASVTPVTVSYTHSYLFLSGIARFFGASFGTKTLTARASMRSETPATSCP